MTALARRLFRSLPSRASVGTRARRAALLASLACLGGCSVQRYVMKTATENAATYFQAPGYTGVAFEKVSAHAYSFRWTWYRDLVVVTSEGLVVVDPMNAEATRALRLALDETFPGVPVRALVYSHFHLDHVEGGAILQPREVIAHAGCAQHWKSLDAHDVLPPNTWIEGDQTRVFGDTEIRFVYLPGSHTDTMYGIFVPGERTLFLADLALIRTVPPFGYPDANLLGDLAAYDKLAALDFSVYVPSHFGYGTKADFLQSAGFTRHLVALSDEARHRYGVTYDEKTLGRYFDFMYDDMKSRYGDWRGFDEMGLLAIYRGLIGSSLGY